MAEELSFADLIRRVRARDDLAAEKLVRQYEPVIRVAIRVRLTDPSLRRLFDSMDICQSVLGNFFVRAASGQFELDTPQQLMNLLVTMARNKVTNYALRQQAARRDQRRVRHDPAAVEGCADPRPGPSEVVSQQELLREFRSRLTPEERRLADLRADGQSWAQVAEQVGGNPDVLRMRLTRALDRVARDLDLDA